MLKEADLRRSDLFSGSLISLTGVGVIVGASKMPMGGTYGGVDNPWYASPGAIPLFLGCLFCLFGLAVVLHGWRQGGARDFRKRVFEPWKDLESRRRAFKVGALWGGLLLYVLMLSWKPFARASLGLGQVISPTGHLGFLTEANGANYWISSALYLSVFVFIFGRWNLNCLYRPKNLGLVFFLWMAPLLLGYVFAVHLRVPLP